MESLVKAQVTTQHASVHVPSEDLAALDTALVAVHDALHVVLRQMHQHTSAPTGTTSATGLEVDVQLRDQLKHFAELLRNADLTALSLHRELQQHHAEILQPHAQLLAQSIHEFDFGRAATLCDALLANLFLKGETS
jgi:hypothetical protein